MSSTVGLLRSKGAEIFHTKKTPYGELLADHVNEALKKAHLIGVCSIPKLGVCKTSVAAVYNEVTGAIKLQYSASLAKSSIEAVLEEPSFKRTVEPFSVERENSESDWELSSYALSHNLLKLEKELEPTDRATWVSNLFHQLQFFGQAKECLRGVNGYPVRPVYDRLTERIILKYSAVIEKSVIDDVLRCARPRGVGVNLCILEKENPQNDWKLKFQALNFKELKRRLGHAAFEQMYL